MNDYFEEMNIDYSELNDYEDIETYYDKIKDYSNLVNELQCDRVESQKYIVRANKKIEQLQSNWNSLREWLKECSQDLEFRCYMDIVLDKMNELESGDNND